MNGIRAKWVEASEYLDKFDICTFTETKLDDKANINKTGYTVNRADRDCNGGGVATYVADWLKPCTLVELQDRAKQEHIEATLTSITVSDIPSKNKVIVIGIYRPPSSPVSWFTALNSLLVDVTKLGQVIMMGDINADMRKPTKYPGKALTRSMALINGRVDCFDATRIGAKTATCLDVIIIDKDIECRDYKVESKAASDHFPVSAVIRCNISSKKGPQPVWRRSLKGVAMKELEARASVIQLNDCGQTPDTLLEEWQNGLLKILDDVAPIKPYPYRSQKCPWMNGDVRKRITDRDNLAKILKSKPPGDHDYGELEKVLGRLKRSAKSRLRRAAKNFGLDALEEKNHKRAWKFIREVTLTSSTAERNKVDPQVMNDFMASTVCSPSQQELIHITGCDMEDSFSFRTLVVPEVRRMLHSTKTNTATGHDQISGYLLKALASAIAPNVTKIFNASLAQGNFPEAWKKANVSAIWKGKGSKSDPANYRPISVLPVIARIFERACASQLSDYCDKRELIPARQFGFRAGSGCELALLSAVDHWMSQIDKGNIVGALLVDLSKAFDSVNHQTLLMELMKAGCAQSASKWFHSYLSGREQRVIQRPETTAWKPVTRGVPQGSALSPLLFNVYTSGLPLVCQSVIHQYADDITPSEADSSAQVVLDRLAGSFEQIKTFCEDHDLLINAEKTQLLLMKAPSKKLPDNLELSLNGSIIKPSPDVKLLGAMIDKHLTFGADIDRIVLKCHGLIGVLARTAPFLPTQLLRMAYIALIRSHLEYAGAIRASAAKTQLQKLDVIQKMGARIILRAPRNAHAAPLMQTLRLDTLENRRNNHIIELVEACMSDAPHPAFKGMFERQPDGSAANDATARTGIGRRRFSIYAKTLFNARQTNAAGGQV